MQPSILFIDKLENKIDYLVNRLRVKRFTLYVHPYVYAFINKGFFSLKYKWKFKYGFGIRIIPMQDYAFLQYKFVDKAKNEIDLREEIE
jgi:ribonuclease G